jgi:hypothetical protein
VGLGNGSGRKNNSNTEPGQTSGRQIGVTKS